MVKELLSMVSDTQFMCHPPRWSEAKSGGSTHRKRIRRWQWITRTRSFAAYRVMTHGVVFGVIVSER